MDIFLPLLNRRERSAPGQGGLFDSSQPVHMGESNSNPKSAIRIVVRLFYLLMSAEKKPNGYVGGSSNSDFLLSAIRMRARCNFYIHQHIRWCIYTVEISLYGVDLSCVADQVA
jgi:hypothetical protein